MLSAAEGEKATGHATRLAEVLCPVVAEIEAQDVPVAVHGTCRTYSGLGANVLPLLREALREILTNAREAIEDRPAGEIRVGVTLARGRLRIGFRDTGCGIPCGDPAEAFAPFFTTKPGHLGLGLPLCRAALRVLGGTVSVGSTGARGTEVVVELPCLCGTRGGPRRVCGRREISKA